MNEIYKEKIEKRFIQYVKIWSESDSKAADNGVFPSTKQQLDFAKILVNDLKEIGLKNARLTKDGYVYASSKENLTEDDNSVLFLAHMDTVDEVSGKNVKPVIKHENSDTIICSDGSTLLGADDKAGICAIFTAVQFILENNLNHIPFEIIFSPDEETGHGMDKVPLDLIKSKYAYTVDGGEEGQLECECFNAWSCTIDFTGKACHTGTAKEEGMINAILMASTFVTMLPSQMRPETTENREGFIAPLEITGSIEKAQVYLLLRSFDKIEIENQKSIIDKISNVIKQTTGGQIQTTYKQQYLNMKEKLDENPKVIEKLEKAYTKAGVHIINTPIRGGTDGSRLTELGIPTPNIFTGGHNFHSRNEWCSLNQMSKSADVIVNILTQID